MKESILRESNENHDNPNLSIKKLNLIQSSCLKWNCATNMTLLDNLGSSLVTSGQSDENLSKKTNREGVHTSRAILTMHAQFFDPLTNPHRSIWLLYLLAHLHSQCTGTKHVIKTCNSAAMKGCGGQQKQKNTKGTIRRTINGCQGSGLKPHPQYIPIPHSTSSLHQVLSKQVIV